MKIKKFLPIIVTSSLILNFMPCAVNAEEINSSSVFETKYVNAEVGLNVRTGPSTETEIITALPLNSEINCTVSDIDDEWSLVILDDGKFGYVFNEYVSDEKTIIEKPTITTSNVLSSNNSLYSPSYFRQMGVINWNGYRWTYYSERVLPGTGLNIPGRWTDGNGYVCDGDGYVCLASSDLSKGTVVSTPFGRTGKVYDCGCASGTLDVYVNW